MAKGTIYWDESSRGYHGNVGHTPYSRGRWVGERTENGRRVRMRSTDYNKVLAWLNGITEQKPKDGIRLKGLETYSVNVEKQEVYGRSGHQLKALRKGCRVWYSLWDKDRTRQFSFNRLAYAALHDIDVRLIPDDIIVIIEDGEYKLQYRGDFRSDVLKRLNEDNRIRIGKMLSRRKRETEILQRYYDTGDSTELVSYATTEIFDFLVTGARRRWSCRMQKAVEMTLEATEIFLSRVMEQRKPVTDITAAIANISIRQYYERRNQREYKDNIRHE